MTSMNKTYTPELAPDVLQRRNARRRGPRLLRTEGEGALLVRTAVERLGLSARAYDKVRRVARTIADMDQSANIQEMHLAEAVQYRLLDRKF